MELSLKSESVEGNHVTPLLHTVSLEKIRINTERSHIFSTSYKLHQTHAFIQLALRSDRALVWQHSPLDSGNRAINIESLRYSLIPAKRLRPLVTFGNQAIAFCGTIH
jgi:hypothetical protein